MTMEIVPPNKNKTSLTMEIVSPPGFTDNGNRHLPSTKLHNWNPAPGGHTDNGILHPGKSSPRASLTLAMEAGLPRQLGKPKVGQCFGNSVARRTKASVRSTYMIRNCVSGQPRGSRRPPSTLNSCLEKWACLAATQCLSPRARRGLASSQL